MLFLVFLVKIFVFSSVLAQNQSNFQFYDVADPRKSPHNYTNLKAADYPIIKPKFKIPKSFDARQKWPECKSIRTPEIQGQCGNNWANAVVATISDRWCVAYGPKNQRFFSADDLTTCCPECTIDKKNGCKGGWVPETLHYWVTNGICSGGQYLTNIGCKPYSDSLYYFLPPEDPGANRPPVPCEKRCYNKDFPDDYEKDKEDGHDFYKIDKNDIAIMQWEIYFFGPIIATYRIYDDLYSLNTDKILMSTGKKTDKWNRVTLIGWGEVNGVQYWLGRNTLGPNWGKHGGFYRLKRGDNRAEIEDFVYAPIITNVARTKTMDAAASTTTESSKSVSSSVSGLRPSNMLPFLIIVYTINRMY